MMGGDLLSGGDSGHSQDYLGILGISRDELSRLRDGCGQISVSFDYRFKGHKPDDSALREAIAKVGLPGRATLRR